MILARSIMLREEAKQNMFEERAIRDERVCQISFIPLTFVSNVFSFTFD